MTKSQIPNPKSQIYSLFIVHCSLLLAFALRLYRLDGQSIWVDEGISLHLATSSLVEIIANRAANIHPPLYFFLLKGWMTLAGNSIFSARFLSAMASLLQVAAVYAIARRWLGRPTALIAAVLTALSPLSVIYAQEIRVYALLPLVYLALLGITHELIHKSSPNRRATWLLLGIIEVVGLHLHYTVLFVVAYTAAWSLWAFWRERRWADLRRWWATQLLAGLASLPWLVTVFAHWPAVQTRLQTGRGFTDPVPLDYLLSQIWVSHLTGLAGALGRPEFRLLAGLTLLFLLVLLLLRLRQPSTRRTIARLTAQWLIPLSLALLVWIVRPFSHPRYVALFAPGLTLLAAYAIYPNSKAQTPKPKPGHCSLFIGHWSLLTGHWSLFIGHCSLLILLLISLLGLRAYFFDPSVAKDDVRGVAHYLQEAAGPDDLILIPDGDWSLTFVYQGTAPVEMPGLPDEDKMWANLARWTTRPRRVFVMNYPQGIGGDQREIIPFALEKAGALHARQDFDDILVRVYHLDHAVEPPALAPIGARFDPLTLTLGWVETESPADTALTLALHWRLPPSPHGGGDGGGVQRHGLTIRLLDVDGWPLAAHDTLLLDEQLRPTDHWPVGQETTTYHVLPIPPSTPPLTYTLALGLYEQTETGPRSLNLLDDQSAPQGQWLHLATVRLTEPLNIAGDPYGTADGPTPLPQPVDLADGLRLLGASLDRSSLGPGQSLFVTQRWQATRSPLPDLRPRLALIQGGQELVAASSAPALGRYPTDRWQAGETVLEHRRLVVPATAADGPADVVLTLGDQRLVLGQVEITTEEHVFTVPPIAHPLDVRFGQVARLVGYDLPSENFTAGETIPLTLYWQALEGATGADYAIFTHVLAADGHLVGQHDGPPASGARPTAGWVPGEIITDQHVM
ncbi:MAG: glycosyltransferase family 39 protein, partial [Anaerolineae bacterium]